MRRLLVLAPVLLMFCSCEDPPLEEHAHGTWEVVGGAYIIDLEKNTLSLVMQGEVERVMPILRTNKHENGMMFNIHCEDPDGNEVVIGLRKKELEGYFIHYLGSETKAKKKVE
ncbi:MAG: hypothetical protein ACYTAF_17340 [Planctomycetota bacterium]